MSAVLGQRCAELHCLSEPHRIEALDIDHLVDELADGTPPEFLTPERLCVQDLVVLAIEPESGRYLGLLGARDDLAGDQPYLRLDMACVAPAWRGQRLMSRMLARAAAARVRQAPILAARTGTPSWFRALRHFAGQVGGAAFHPAPAGSVVTLRTAAVARRIAASLCPEQRYDLATGVLHGNWMVPARTLHRHTSADAWCAAAHDAMPLLSERLLAVIDLRGVNRAALRKLAG
jgi:GNAT superfamily N-acetyltransferase